MPADGLESESNDEDDEYKDVDEEDSSEETGCNKKFTFIELEINIYVLKSVFYSDESVEEDEIVDEEEEVECDENEDDDEDGMFPVPSGETVMLG